MPKRSNTRGANGDGTIRKRPDGRWEGRYSYGFNPRTGKPNQKSVYGKTQKEVRIRLKQITSEIDLGVYTEPTKMTLGTWLDIWIEDYNKDVKPATLDQYKYQIRVHLKPNLGAVRLPELTAPMVQHVYNKLMEPYKLKQKNWKGKDIVRQRKGLSAKSIKNMNSVLHSALSQAVKLGYIPTNICSALTLPKVRKTEMHPVTGESLNALLKAIKGNPYEELIYVTMFTGLRQGEIIGLTWDCINLDTGMMTIYRQLQKQRETGSEYKFLPLKNSKSRTFMVADNVIKMLKRQKTKQSEMKLKAGKCWKNEEGFVFTDELGNHISKYTAYENFKRCAAEAGIPATRFHDLRHTYATLALEQGTNIKTVSSNLGHATVAFTLDVYGHVDEQMQKDSANRMQAFLETLCSGN